jgi:hypothetical protein
VKSGPPKRLDTNEVLGSTAVVTCSNNSKINIVAHAGDIILFKLDPTPFEIPRLLRSPQRPCIALVSSVSLKQCEAGVGVGPDGIKLP